MKVTAAWMSFGMVVIIPIATILTVMYSDVQALKETKEDKVRVLEMKVEFTKQLTRNATVMENLNSTLIRLEGRLDGKHTFSNGG